MKPSYFKGELVNFPDLLWFQYDYDLTFSRMKRLIEEISEQMINDYVKRKLIKNIDKDDRRHLKNLQENFSTSIKEGRGLIAPLASIFTYSEGSRWRAGCKIPTICLTKRQGSRRAKDEEQCYTKYDKTQFLEHLVST